HSRPDPGRHGRHGNRASRRGLGDTIGEGAEGSRWVPRSSKPVARRSASRGGFDSHALPPVGGLAATMTDTARNGRPRPPSVERLLRAAHDRLDGRAHDAVVAAARAVIDAERGRLEAGGPGSSLDVLAAELADTL